MPFLPLSHIISLLHVATHARVFLRSTTFLVLPLDVKHVHVLPAPPLSQPYVTAAVACHPLPFIFSFTCWRLIHFLLLSRTLCASFSEGGGYGRAPSLQAKTHTSALDGSA